MSDEKPADRPEYAKKFILTVHLDGTVTGQIKGTGVLSPAKWGLVRRNLDRLFKDDKRSFRESERVKRAVETVSKPVQP